MNSTCEQFLASYPSSLNTTNFYGTGNQSDFSKGGIFLSFDGISDVAVLLSVRQLWSKL